jgi:methyl-accepting chemotaxis protein
VALLGLQDTTAATKQTADVTAFSSTLVTICAIVGVILAVVVATLITGSLAKILRRSALSLNEGAEQVVSAATQVSSSSQSLAEGASEQAASLEETSSSLEELSSMTKRNAENSQKANDLAKQARTSADKGVGDMQAMSSAMEAIKVSSDDIAKIIKTIDEIAFQTNILALEAARAGEAGLGFAVVADEVRNLAHRSAQAAKETAAKIEGAIIKTAQGVDISSKVALTLNEIVTKVRQVDELMAEVADASCEQTQGITQINTAVGQMDKVTQSNAASAEESAAAAEELNAQAETMKQSVMELLQLVGGNSQNTVTRTPSSPARRTVHIASPAAKRPAPVHGNGHARIQLEASGKTNGRNEIPMEGDFRDF